MFWRGIAVGILLASVGLSGSFESTAAAMEGKQPHTGMNAQQAPIVCDEYEKGLFAYVQGKHELALKLLLPCAEAGDPQAQTYVGSLYSIGLGVPHQYEEAVRWLRRAAEQGVAAAQASLANHYLSGQGIQQDASQAIRWFRAAAEQGDRGSQEALGLAYKHGWWGLAPDPAQSEYWLGLSKAHK